MVCVLKKNDKVQQRRKDTLTYSYEHYIAASALATF